MKKWYQSKTVWLGLITTVGGALPLYEAKLREAINGDIASAIIVVVGILIVGLRFITEDPIK